MKIGGLQKLSLLDYPNHLCAVVWTVGCNLRCPYCYNVGLVRGDVPLIPQEHVFDFLEERKDKLEAVCVTGGEPTLQPDLLKFLGDIREMGYLVKLDTNGTRPRVLREIIGRGSVDFLAMDVKTSFHRYHLMGDVDPDDIRESMELIRSSGIEYEFRTTLVPGVVSPDDVLEVVRSISPVKRFVLQDYESRPPHLDPKTEGLEEYSHQELKALKGILCNLVADVSEGGEVFNNPIKGINTIKG